VGVKADLHIHTSFSFDAISSPKDIIRAALDRRLECICITDHNEIKGAVEGMKFAFDKNILVIPGIEVVSTSGDVLGINIKKIIPDGLSVEETIKEIRKQGGIAVIPHPFNLPLGGFWGGEEKLRNVKADCIEVFNASVFTKWANTRALNFSAKHKLSFSGGSDAHRADFVGRGYVEIAEKILSEKDLIEKLLQKKGKPGGSRLSFWELLKNGKGLDVGKTFDYYVFKFKTRHLR